MRTLRKKPRLLTPVKAIRANCIDCSGGNRAEVRRCNIVTCPLWPYRMGMRPGTYERRLKKKAEIASIKTEKSGVSNE